MRDKNRVAPALLLAVGVGISMPLASSPVAQAQELDWATSMGGFSFDEGRSIATDPRGNSYATGGFQGAATFGAGEVNETVLEAVGGNEVFVVKYAPDGALLWATSAGGNKDDAGLGIATGPRGSSYATGGFEGTATFGAGEANETVLRTAGANDVFVAKYAADGALLWATSAGGNRDDWGFGIATGPLGNSYATGFFQDAATLGAGEANETTLTAAGIADVFVAKWLDEPEGKLEVLIAAIKALVAGGDLDVKVAARLIARLDRALDNLAHGELPAACGQLGAFANQVEAPVRGRGLAGEDAAALLTGADEVHYQLGC